MMAYIGNRYARENGAYVYFFNLDAPGDGNGAFHSCDLRYMFGRLETSWRPYKDRDREVSKQMMDYLANFAKDGDPNGEGLPHWDRTYRNDKKVLCYNIKETKMGRASYLELLRNMLKKGEPKA